MTTLANVDLVSAVISSLFLAPDRFSIGKGQLFQMADWEPNEADLLAFAED